MENNLNNKKKYSLAKKIILVGVILVMVFGSVLVTKPKEAQAFLIDFNQGIFNIFKIPYDITSEVYNRLNAIYEEIGAIGFRQALQKIVGNIAVDTATYLATGDKGQLPLFQTSFVDYINKEADAFLGDSLNNQLQQMWGVSLCEPPDALFKVRLEIMAKEYFRAPRPQCTFTKMWKNIRDPRKLQLVDLPTYADMFNPSSNELGMFLTVTSNIQENKIKQEDMTKLQLLIEKGWKSVRSTITGNIKTPADIIGDLGKFPIKVAWEEKSTFTGELAADFIGPFANTLISKLMKRFKEGLVDDSGRATGGRGLGGAYSPSFGGISPIQAARERFATLGQPDYNFGGPFDLLNSLSCENTESSYSCVIDNAFRTAIMEEPHLTVEQALDPTRNFLHGDWPFGYRVDKSGGIDDASQSIYSYRSLVILRKYRIIPVGWELAAEYYRKYDRTGDSLTLNRLIGEYNNPDSPYYRLVDPGWVLKAPQTLCEREGSGELLIEETILVEIDLNQDGEISEDERQEMVIRKSYCADERSCIKESLDGRQCEYYGYCTKEKPIWRIQSENGECLGIYNSCRAYRTRDNQQVGYLYNTLWGKDVCGAEDVGCREYCIDWNLEDREWSCEAGDSTNRIFLNRQASDNECGQDESGCSQLVRMSAALTTPSNWLPNSSFEEGSQAATPIDFSYYNTAFVTFSGGGNIINTDSYDGIYAYDGSIGATGFDIGSALAGRTFTLSVYYKGGDVDLTLGGLTNSFVDQGSWGRASITRSYALTDPSLTISFSISGSAIIDAMSLVEAEESNIFTDYGSINKANLRLAPNYLGCEGYMVITGDNESSCVAPNFWRDDIERCVESGSYECDDYALTCSDEDAECRFYNPVSYQGLSVPGVVSSVNMCPAECVGYKTYMEQPSFLEPILPAGRNPINLIARTAETCPAVDNGCEEFTNLSEGPQGERKEYYSALRSCILPGSSGTANYYTWESTDETGNQLRNWELLETNSDGAPCTNSQTDEFGVVSCTDNVNPSFECSFGNPDPDFNPVYNPDCVEFTAQSGNTYWMHFSRIIITNDDCVPMRRTVGQSIYSVSPNLSQTCTASSVGCREYKGSAANNIEIVLNDDFESGTDDGWQGGVLNNESLIANGHSLYADGVMGYIRKEAIDLIEQGKSYRLSFWAKGNGSVNSIDRISFFDDINNIYSVFDDSVSISLRSEWGYYVVVLNNLNREITDQEYLLIESGDRFYIDNIILTETQDDLYLIQDSWQTPLACDNPIDNPTASPATSLGEMVGCEQYQDVENRDWYLRSFDKLCRDEVVGCELMIDTYNSEVPFEQVYNNINVDPADNVTTPADSLIYLVYDEQKACNEVGCVTLGLIEPSRQENEMLFNTKNLIVKPDDFGGFNSPLCEIEKLWCNEFSPLSGGVEYFKNPNVFTCEYREVGGNYGWYQTGSDSRCLSIEAEQGYCMGGRSMINSESDSNFCWENDDCADYASFSAGGLCSSWVGVCPVSEDKCTEYQDPSTPKECDKLSVNGEDTGVLDGVEQHCDFYYYQSDKVDNESCNSQINPDQGCMGFHQTDGGEDVWYSTKRCSGDTSVPCQSDEDCIYHSSGNNLGRCIAVPEPVVHRPRPLPRQEL